MTYRIEENKYFNPPRFYPMECSDPWWWPSKDWEYYENWHGNWISFGSLEDAKAFIEKQKQDRIESKGTAKERASVYHKA